MENLVIREIKLYSFPSQIWVLLIPGKGIISVFDNYDQALENYNALNKFNHNNE